MNEHLRTIVAGIATVEPRDPALDAAVALARRTGAHLHLVHVHPAEGDDDGPGWHFAARPAPAAESIEARLREQADEACPGACFACAARAGRAGDVLPRYAAEVGADLLVLGPPRRHGSTALGATAARALRLSAVPVLVLQPELAAAPARRVLLPTDLSEHSALALPLARELAAALAMPAQPELWPLFVCVPEVETEVSPGALMVQDAAAELAGFLDAVPGFAAIPGSVRVGFPAHQILAAAREWGAELVVLGTHGRRGLPRFFLGSVAETVLRKAPCSALVVPPAAARAAADAALQGAAWQPSGASFAEPASLLEAW